MLTRSLALVGLLTLAGCASAEITQRRALVDDAKCQSSGAKPGEPAYVQCGPSSTQSEPAPLRCGERCAAAAPIQYPPDRLSSRAASGAVLTGRLPGDATDSTLGAAAIFALPSCFHSQSSRPFRVLFRLDKCFVLDRHIHYLLLLL
jgi:hypothetical protein